MSPKQLVSVAASLIPFLENDDANRALMGSNMQRQAVPLLRAEAPLVGTGMEAITAKDSGAVVVAQRSGVVDQVDSQRIIVRVTGDAAAEGEPEDYGADIYTLTKFRRSQPEHLHQPEAARDGRDNARAQGTGPGGRPLHGHGASWRWGATSWWPSCRGAATTSRTRSSCPSSLVTRGLFTSIHIEEFEIEARDTKLGPEEITRDIPNVSEEMPSRTSTRAASSGSARRSSPAAS